MTWPGFGVTRADARRFVAALALWGLAGQAEFSHAQCPTDDVTKLLSLEFGSDQFGQSVAVDGDTIVVGSWLDNLSGGANDAGSAYVFVYAGGTWSQQAKLTASDAAANDHFGRAVAVSGDIVIVGSPNDDHAAGADAGSAYVFIRSNGVWSQQAKLTASDAAAGDEFGYSVAIDGETAVIGARFDSHAGGSLAGSAYVFIRCSGVTWTQQSKLTASDGTPNDFFGASVVISGNTVLAGAYDYDGIEDGAGAAYVFIRTGASWSQQQKLTAFDTAEFDHFGFSVALSGNTAIVSAHLDDHAGGINGGSAHVFTRTGSIWTFQTKLTASDSVNGLEFGWSVALSGNIAVVSSRNDDDAGNLSGSVYAFKRTGVLWTQEAKIVAADGAIDDQFGTSVALSGVRGIGGAPFDDHFFGSDSGSAYVFDLICDADGDGVPDGDDVCPASDPAFPVCANGRPQRDCNNDCLVNGLDVACIAAEMLE